MKNGSSYWATVILVVYNENVADIEILRKLRKYSQEILTIVCDNSTTIVNHKEDLWETAIYLSMGGNKGLSRAYNKALEYICGKVVCIFDDDSILCDGYFDVLKNEYLNGGWDVLLPVVFSNNRMLSPTSFNGFRSSQTTFSKLDDIDGRKLSGINSGMMIRPEVFNHITYDEGLFLDLIDHQFCEDVKQCEMRIGIAPKLRLEQAYSFVSDDPSSAFSRFEIFSRDARHFYDSNLLKRLYCSLMLVYRAFKLSARYRSLRYFGVIFDEKGNS